MKRALIICLFWAISLNAGNCATPMFPPLQPLGGNNNNGVTSLANPYAKNPSQDTSQNNYLSDSSVSYPKINEIEHSLYGQNFTNQDILLRLARIEKSLFGTSYSNLSLAQRVDNIVMNFNQINEFPNISKNTLSGMESKVFKKSFAKNNVENRVERLEQQIFGAVQSGDMETRFETLKAAVKSYNPNPLASDYNQNLGQNLGQDPMMMQNTLGQNPFAGKQGGLRGILGGLGNMMSGGGFGGMGGTMTGFTPPIDPYNNYNTNNNLYNNGYNNNNGYYNNGYNNNFANLGSPSGGGIYRGYRSNHEYSDSFSNYGSGSKVTILD